ncbi:MAG: TetR/AcrR family transcriptional regulator, partial [Pseudonocardiaceae bacterium]
AARGLMSVPEDEQRLRSIVDATWIISENWLNYIEFHDGKLTPESILAGYHQILEILRPYLCADIQQITRESYLTIQQMTPYPQRLSQPAQYPISVTS